MKERSKEKIAELMMDELLTQLSERGRVRKLLGEMTGLPIGPLVEDLLREFEEIVERYHERNLASGVTASQSRPEVVRESYTPTSQPSTPLPIIPDVVEKPALVAIDPPTSIFAPDKPVQPPSIPVTSILPPAEPLKAQPTPASESNGSKKEEKKSSPQQEAKPEGRKDTGKDVTDFRSKLEELARRVESEYLQKLEQKGPKKREPVDLPVETGEEKEVPSVRQKPREAIEVGPGEGGRPSRIPFRIDDQEYMYIHGAMFIPPGERACEHPFMLEEKGIDGREFGFAIDLEDIRFFLSKINQKEMNVSRKGVLLLGKAESIQLNGLHQGILNELRAHGIVLPMEFGTVAKGKADLQGLAGRFHEDLRSSLTRLAKTSWWTLNMSVLDGRIAQLFADEQGTKAERDGRQRDRVSYSAGSFQGKKFDVKLLEKILQKEKRLAESVHQELSSVAERCEIQTMVGLGSGSSDDWKLILRATYLVTGNIGYQRFTRAVTDLQYRHILFEPMLSLTGDAEDFSFLRK